MPLPADPWPEHDDAWARLMDMAQGGDRAAYERLLTEIVPYLRMQARRFLRSREDIEDAVQDVLVTIHTIRHTYDPARPFRPWLVTIARRRFIDRVRQRIRTVGREVVLDESHETFAVPEPNSDTGESASRALRRALETLPPGQRRAVEMLKLKEMSLKEASAESGMSVAALKVAMHRALKALKLSLGSK
jgi:RNA polymerase sigma-70 factor, ECF subfamily